MEASFAEAVAAEARECAAFARSCVVVEPPAGAPAGAVCVHGVTADAPRRDLTVVVSPGSGASAAAAGGDGRPLAADGLHALLMQASPAYARGYMAAVAAKLAARASDSDSSDEEGGGGGDGSAEKSAGADGR
jgi:hypothetical protein